MWLSHFSCDKINKYLQYQNIHGNVTELLHCQGKPEVWSNYNRMRQPQLLTKCHDKPSWRSRPASDLQTVTLQASGLETRLMRRWSAPNLSSQGSCPCLTPAPSSPWHSRQLTGDQHWLETNTEHPTTCCTRPRVSSGNVAEGGLGGMKGTKKGMPRNKQKQENPFTTNYDGVVS